MDPKIYDDMMDALEYSLECSTPLLQKKQNYDEFKFTTHKLTSFVEELKTFWVKKQKPFSLLVEEEFNLWVEYYGEHPEKCREWGCVHEVGRNDTL